MGLLEGLGHMVLDELLLAHSQSLKPCAAANPTQLHMVLRATKGPKTLNPDTLTPKNNLRGPPTKSLKLYSGHQALLNPTPTKPETLNPKP